MNWFNRLFSAKPTPPEEVVNTAVDQARAALSADLMSAFVYGSFATGEYVEGHSNLNVLLVVRKTDPETLKKLAPVSMQWERFASFKPLVLSLPELKVYAECFPMEFADMAEFRRLVGGEDVFQKIETSSAHLAEELESEIRICLVKLRRRWLLSGGQEEALREQIASVSKALFPILRGFLRLKKRKPPKQRVRLIEECCRNYRFGRRTLLQVHDLRFGRRNAERIEVLPLAERLLQELDQMAEEAFRMTKGDGEEKLGRPRERDHERESAPSQVRGGGDRNAKVGQIRQLIQEASQRKKWEPKEPERFSSDEFSRDLSLTLSARFGWDRAWQPERRAKGYVPLKTETPEIEEPSYEEEFGESATMEEQVAQAPEAQDTMEESLRETVAGVSPHVEE